MLLNAHQYNCNYINLFVFYYCLLLPKTFIISFRCFIQQSGWQHWMQSRGDVYAFSMHIYYLSGVMETFPDDPVHNDPGEHEEAEEVRLDLPHLRDVLAHVEHLVTRKLKCL